MYTDTHMLHFSPMIISLWLWGDKWVSISCLNKFHIINRWLLSAKNKSIVKLALHFIFVIAENSKISVFDSKEFAIKKTIQTDRCYSTNRRIIVLFDYLQDIGQPLQGNKVEGIVKDLGDWLWIYSKMHLDITNVLPNCLRCLFSLS